MDMVLKRKVTRRLWRLRDSDVKEKFVEGVNNKCNSNEDWYGLKKKLLDVASEICGYAKGKPTYFETWWWNKDVVVAECRKRELYI